MALLPDLVGRIRIDMSELNRAQSEATSRGAAVGSALGTAIGSLAGGLLAEAGQRIMTFVSGSVDAFAKLQDATSVAGIRFGAYAGDVDRFAAGAAKSLGMSKASALEAANTFSVFGKQLNLTGAPLADFSTGMTKLAGDMASFVGTSPEEAIQAIGSAFRGEYDPIEKYGVVLSAAAVQNKALEMGMVPVNGQLTQQQKILATQKLIWEQTSDAQGDFARTGDSVANTQHRIAAETENAQAALGEKLAPAYLAVLNALNPLITGLTDFVGKMTDVVRFCWEWRDAFVALGAVLLIMNARIIAFNAQMVAFLVISAARNAVAAFTTAFWALNAAMIANPVGAVIAVIAALVAGLVVAYNHSETFRNAVDALFAKLKEFIDWASPAFTEWAAKVGTSFGQAVTDLDNFGTGVNNWLTKMKNSLSQAVTDVDGFGDHVNKSLTETATDLDRFGDNVNALPGKVAAGLARFAQILWDSIVAGWNRARDESGRVIGIIITDVQALPGKIVGALQALPGQMVQMGRDIMNGLLQGLQQLGPTIVSYLTNLIPDPVKNALNIHSPSGIMKDIGIDVMRGLDAGLQSWIPKIQSTLGKILDMVQQHANEISQATGIAAGKINTAVGQGRQLVGGLTSASQGIMAEDNTMVNPHFYDEIMIGKTTYKKGDPGYEAARKRIGLGPSDSGTTYNVDARSFGTQLKPQDVADAIKWAAKIGGLVSA